MDAHGKSWWHTLPGVLTALAAVITAAAGLVGVLSQNGVLGARAQAEEPVAPAPLSAFASAPAESAAAPARLERRVETPAPPPAPVRAVVQDADGYTNVRSGPGTAHPVTARILEGETFEVLNREGNWWRVATPAGITGYVHRSRVRVLP